MQTAAWDWVWSYSHYAVRHLHVYASLSFSFTPCLPPRLPAMQTTQYQATGSARIHALFLMADGKSTISSNSSGGSSPNQKCPQHTLAHTHTHTHTHKAPVSPLITPSHHRHNNNSLFVSHNTAAQEPLLKHMCPKRPHTHTFCQLWCVLQRPGSLHSWAEILREGLGVKERPLMSVKERDAPTMLESARGRRC